MSHIHLTIKNRETVESISEDEILLVAVLIGLKPDKFPLFIDLSSLIEIYTQFGSGVMTKLWLNFLIFGFFHLSRFSNSFGFGYKLILMEELLVSSRIGVVCHVFVLNL